MKKNQVDFQFSKNWRAFDNWCKSAKIADWDIQAKKIEILFRSTCPDIPINWLQLWVDLETWYDSVFKKKREVLWREQKRQIETLLLKQLDSFNEEKYSVGYLNTEGSRPRYYIDDANYTYWEAMQMKKNLEQTSGFEKLKNITVIDYSQIIKK